MGDRGRSGAAGMGGGGGTAMLGKALASLDFGRLGSTCFRFEARSPGGREETALEDSCVAFVEVAGLLISSDGLGRGPSLTLGLLY